MTAVRAGFFLACFLFFSASMAQAAETLFLKGTAGTADVMVRLSPLAPGVPLPKVYGNLDSSPYAWYGAYYGFSEGENRIEIYLVGLLSSEEETTLRLHAVEDGQAGDPLWVFTFPAGSHPSETLEWEGILADGKTPLRLSLWDISGDREPELDDDYNAPRVDRALEMAKSIDTPVRTAPSTRLRYRLIHEELANTVYPRLVDYPDERVMKAVNDQMEELQKNLMKYHLACLANGRSVPAHVDNRTSVTLLTPKLLSAAMHYRYTNANPDAECHTSLFPDPVNVALEHSFMEPGEILGMEDMFTKNALEARALQHYAWKRFSEEHPDASACRDAFRNEPEDVSLTFTEDGAIFELSLSDEERRCMTPVTIEASFLKRIARPDGPLAGLWD